MIRSHSETDELALARYMQSMGLSLGDVAGPFKSASGQLAILYDDGTPATVTSTIGVAGTSAGTADGGTPNVAEVGAVVSVVTDEELTASVGESFTGTLAEFPVLPRTAVLVVAGTGQRLYDNGSGRLLNSGDDRPRGSIDYATGALSVTFGVRDYPSGALLASYRSSTSPDYTDLPLVVRIDGVTLSGFTATTAVTVKIYEDEARTALRWSGAGTTDADGDLYLVVGLISRTQETADLTKRGRRWVVVGGDTAEGTVSLSWARA